jgi:membrane-associated phospholipid phosphatase
MSEQESPHEARSGPGRVSGCRPALLVALVALALFACLGALVSAQPRTAFDDRVRAAMVASHGPAGTSVFSRVSTVGSVTPMIAYAVIVVLVVAAHRRSMIPLTILFAPVVAVLAYLGTKSIVLRTRPSGVGNAFEGTYSFPSAHATTSSAVCSAVAYLLYREGLVSDVAALTGAALIALVIGLSRIYLDVHWTTDVLGGWCLGIAIGATASALYESAGGAPARAGLLR